MDEPKKIRKYIKHVVNVARVLTRGISKENEYRQFIKRNIEREWNNFRKGDKTAEQIQRNVVDIFYTVFPQHRMKNFIPSFKEFLCEEGGNDNPKQYNIERRVEQDEGDIQVVPPNKRARNQPAECKKKRASECPTAHPDAKRIKETNSKSSVSFEDNNEGVEGLERIELNEKENRLEKDENDEELDKSEDQQHWLAMKTSESNSTVKRSLLNQVIKRAIKNHRLGNFEEGTLDIIDLAVRIRLKHILKDLKKYSSIRRRNQKLNLLKPEGNRVNVLLRIDREVEEVRLLRMRDERLAMRQSIGNDTDSVESQCIQKNVKTTRTLGLTEYQEFLAGKQKLRKNERQKLEALKLENQGRQRYLERYIDKKIRRRRRERYRAEFSQLSDINTLKKDAKKATAGCEKGSITRNMDMKAKLLQLPGLVTPAHLWQIGHLGSDIAPEKASFYSTKPITLFDCDLLMEFDPQLRKSNLRLKWISRHFVA